MKVRVTLSIGLSNAKVVETLNVPDSLLVGLPEHQRDRAIENIVEDWKSERVDCGWEVVE